MKRITNQKLIILDFLRKTKIHPTAEQVFLEVQKKLPQISKATVYRILDNFVNEDVIRSIADKNKTGSPVRFDGNEKSHQHFICTNCGEITDLYNDKIKKYLNNKQVFIKEGVADGFEVNFYGRCKKCSEN
jgi:Fur family ferric uptake transcriptional regulator